jgi:hypothetical protein
MFHVKRSGLAIKGPLNRGLFASKSFAAKANLGNYLAGARRMGSWQNLEIDNKLCDLQSEEGSQCWNKWITGPKGHWTVAVGGILYDGKDAPHHLQYINSNNTRNNARLLSNGTIRTLRAIAKGAEIFMAYGKSFQQLHPHTAVATVCTQQHKHVFTTHITYKQTLVPRTTKTFLRAPRSHR